MERDLHVEIAHTAEHIMELEFWGLFGLKEEKEPLSFFNEQLVMGSISMTSIQLG